VPWAWGCGASWRGGGARPDGPQHRLLRAGGSVRAVGGGDDEGAAAVKGLDRDRHEGLEAVAPTLRSLSVHVSFEGEVLQYAADLAIAVGVAKLQGLRRLSIAGMATLQQLVTSGGLPCLFQLELRLPGKIEEPARLGALVPPSVRVLRLVMRCAESTAEDGLLVVCGLVAAGYRHACSVALGECRWNCAALFCMGQILHQHCSTAQLDLMRLYPYS
jgi:hypothetical protein